MAQRSTEVSGFRTPRQTTWLVVACLMWARPALATEAPEAPADHGVWMRWGSRLAPNGVTAQVGGHAGAGAVGVSWTAPHGSGARVLLGLVPGSHRNRVWQLTVRAQYYPFAPLHFSTPELPDWLPLFAGLGGTYGLNGRLWVTPPSRYPRDWTLQPTAVRPLLTLGTSARRDRWSASLTYSVSDIDMRILASSRDFLAQRHRLWGVAAVGSVGWEVTWHTD